MYLSWHGTPQNGLLSILARLGVASQASFWNRYRVAERVGAGVDFQLAVRDIVAAVKHAPGPESPLILVGHSMGALMMQSAFATLLEEGALLEPAEGGSATSSSITSRGNPVLFPDLILSLNSAADSTHARRILSAYDRLELTKITEGRRVAYHTPLFASITSTADSATGTWWPRARLGRVTDGHDTGLSTHSFRLQQRFVGAPCSPKPGEDFGQNWHCIHLPSPPRAATPSILIDLPTRDRKTRDDRNVPHAQYSLAPLGDVGIPRLQWVFQVPADVIAHHNDIFNSKARSLALAMIQASGAVASLASDWDDTFLEP